MNTTEALAPKMISSKSTHEKSSFGSHSKSQFHNLTHVKQ